MTYTGLCRGGPLNGRTISAPTDRMLAAIPSDLAVDGGPGDIRTVEYRWRVEDGLGPVWVLE